MSSSNKGKTDPQVRVDGDSGVIFPVHADPTDDTPTIISKSHPEVDIKPAAGARLPEVGIKASADHLGNNLRGRRLAHFELIEPIGVGGMAAVLRARDTQLDRDVALKILPPEMAVDPENVRRFHQEARAAAQLDHPNIARVFFCGEDQGLHFIAFEFVEGQNICDADRAARPAAGATKRCATSSRSRPAWSTRRRAAWSTATSSRRTSSSAPTAAPSSWTWDWPAAWNGTRRGPDAVRRHARHVRLHLARAGPGAARRRRAQRHLFAGLHLLPHADRACRPCRKGPRRRSCTTISTSRRSIRGSSTRKSPMTWR